MQFYEMILKIRFLLEDVHIVELHHSVQDHKCAHAWDIMDFIYKTKCWYNVLYKYTICKQKCHCFYCNWLRYTRVKSPYPA